MGKGGSQQQEVNEYRMSLHYGVCHGPVTFTKITIDDKVLWEGRQSNYGYADISLPGLFGGTSKEGGVAGRVYFLPGRDDQTMPEDLAIRLGLTGATCPAYRGIASLFFVGGPTSAYSGSGLIYQLASALVGIPHGQSGGFLWTSNSPFIKAVKVEVENSNYALNSTNAMIGKNANPSHMIYERLTNTDWGMGAPGWLINRTSFETFAQVLVNEAFALSMIWTKQTDIESSVGEILDHAQATVYVDPKTGLFSIRALRDDYDLNSIRDINPGNAKMVSFMRKLWGETANEIIVTWTNPVNEQEETISDQDLVNIAIQGAPISDNRNYYAVRSAELASRLLARELRQVSAPLAACEIEVDRTRWDVLPGEVMRVTWPKYQLDGVIMRVMKIDYGKAGSPMIKLSLMEDIFSLTKPPVNLAPATGWQGVNELPAAMAFTEVITLPAYIATKQFGGGTNLQYPEVYAGILAHQPGADTVSYEMLSEATAANGDVNWYFGGIKTVLGRVKMITPLYQEPVSNIQGFPLSSVLRGPQLGSLAFIGTGGDAGMEIVLLRAYEGGSWTVDRGMLDTVPRAWPIDTPVWFLPIEAVIGDGFQVRSVGESPEYKLLTRTSLGTLAFEDAPVIGGTMTARPHAPLRPANVKINGAGYGEIDAGGTSNITITWATRNRLFEDGQLSRWTDGAITPEYLQMTVVTVFRANGAPMITYRGLYTQNTLVIPIAYVQQESRIFVRVSSERGGISSVQSYGLWVKNIPQVASPGAPPVPVEPAPPAPPAPLPDPTPDPTPTPTPTPPTYPGGGTVPPGEWTP